MGPGGFRRQGLFSLLPFICSAMPEKTHLNTANQALFHPQILLTILFWGNEVTDAGLANLKGLTQLQSLDLGAIKVTDDNC